MAIIPLVFLVQPLVSVFAALLGVGGRELSQHHELLYMLAIPALVPAALAAYAVVGERQQGTLEPVLSTPIRREELLLGKALAVLVPAVAVSYASRRVPRPRRAVRPSGRGRRRSSEVRTSSPR